MSQIRTLTLASLAVVLTGCATSTAQVVSRDAGSLTIDQVRAAPYDGPRMRIAVTAFEYRAAKGGHDIGDGMTDMMTDALVNSGRFIVLERERLAEVMAEQDNLDSGRFRAETVAPKGELEGAQLLVRGSITQFEPDCAGGSILIAGSKQSCLAINIRIVDATTGRVVSATTVEGTAANSSVGLIFAGGNLPVGLGAFRRTPMEAAIRNAIEAAVTHVVNTKL